MLIKLSEIHLSPTNPRVIRNERLDAELLESVRRHGVLQPVLVRAKALLKKRWELVAGSRRYHAAVAAGLEEIPAIEKDLSDAEVLEVQIIENLQRSDVHPLEEAEAYRQLHESYKHDVARIAERVGRSVAYVYDRIRLCSLCHQAAEHFRAGRIQASHAILLARLKPADQARALDLDKGGVFQNEIVLFNPSNPDEGEDDHYEHVKTRSAKELQGWIDSNVKFDPRADDVPDLFPETHEAVTNADKVVPITWLCQVPPSARDGQKVIVAQSWRRADGKAKSKKCDKSLLGVVVIGGGRGETFDVCVDKTCKVHWADKIRAAVAREKAKADGAAADPAQEKQAARERQAAEQRAREERLRSRWKRALPEITKELAGAVRSIPESKLMSHAEFVCNEISPKVFDTIDARKHIPVGKTPVQLVRHLLLLAAGNGLINEWHGFNYAADIKKRFGVDMMEVVDRVAPDPTAKPAKEAAKPAANSKARKAAPRKKGGSR